MTQFSLVHFSPRHCPVCHSVYFSPFALEPWDHSLPTTATVLTASPSSTLASAEWGLQSRGTTGRGTRRAWPGTAPGVLPSPSGHWPRHPVPVASPTTGRVRAAHTLGIPRPGGSVVRPRYQWSTVPERRSIAASLQKTTLPRALGCQLLFSDPTHDPV